MFSLQNAPLPPLEWATSRSACWTTRPEVSLFDLSFDVTERAHGLLCTLEYNTDLFERRDSRSGCSKHFAVLLDAAVTDPSATPRRTAAADG